MKVRGAFCQLVSLLMLRYTRLNASRLGHRIAWLNIDRLHVGCGDVLLKGWLNIFYDLREEYGRVKGVRGAWLLNYNLLKPWPVADRSIRYIAGSHFIEHLDLNEGIKFLKESYRVLLAGGLIRLSCPDMEIYARNYVANNKSFFEHELIREWCAFKSAETPGEIFVAKAYDSGGSHKWFYDFESLKHILELAGFKEVRKLGRLDGDMPELSIIEPDKRELETLYVEARKI